MTTEYRLQVLSTSNVSTEDDDIWMENLLRKIEFPQAVVKSGLVYLEGIGEPSDIHSVAKMILKVTGIK